MQPVRMASSDVERHAVFRLRYRVFVEGLARSDLDGADHGARILTDELDAGGTHYYAGEPGQPVAALTASPLGTAALPQELREFLDIPTLTQAAPLAQMAFTNWLVADSTEAGGQAVTALLMAAAEWALGERMELLLTFCRPGLVSFYQRLGFEQYRPATDLKGLGLRCPLLLVLRDEARLRAVRSPLTRVLRRSEGVGSPDAVRLRLEPLIDLFQASQILVTDDLWLEGGIQFVERARPRLFDGLSGESIRQVMRLASVISCQAGETITRRNETSDDMFLVVAGQFMATGPTGATRVIGEGELFGEQEHLSGLPRSETVTAHSEGHVAALKAGALFNWMRQNPEPGVTLAINLAKLLAMKLEWSRR